MLIAAAEIARRLNRTLVLPPFTPFKVHRTQGGDNSYPQDRYVSWARLLDMGALNSYVPAAALDAPVSDAMEGWRAQGVSSAIASPPRVIHGRPRWDEMAVDALERGSDTVGLLRLSTNLWGLLPSAEAEASLYSAFRFAPRLVELADSLIRKAVLAHVAAGGGGGGGGQEGGPSRPLLRSDPGRPALVHQRQVVDARRLADDEVNL